MPPENQSLLLALPNEVKRLVCAQLCRHCCKLTPLDIVTPTNKIVSPLIALSETCTVLRDIAQPFLHHVPHIRRYSYFLRTIRERPDLADNVKCLPLMTMTRFTIIKDMAGGGFTLVNEMATELQMFTSEDPPFKSEFSNMLDAISRRINSPDNASFYQMDMFYTLVYAILIASLPRLEILCVKDWPTWARYPSEVLHHAKRRLARAGRLVSDRCSGTSMSSLHTILVNSWRTCENWEEKGEYYRNIHLDPHELLFSCSSALKQLVLHNCDAPYTWPEGSVATGSSIWSTLPELQSIAFEEMAWGCAGHWEENPLPLPTSEEQDTAYLRIQQMVKQCVKLKSFKMAVDCMVGHHVTNSFDPSRLIRALLPAASRMVTLMLHMDTVWIQPDLAILIGADMHSFKRLAELSLDEMCFCHHWVYNCEVQPDRFPSDPHLQVGEEAETANNEVPYSQAYETNSCLVDILPLSVTSLNIRLRKRPRVIPDLTNLGVAAVAGRLPNLRHVTVESYVKVRETALQNRFYDSDFNRLSHQSPATAPQIQALTLRLTEAFRGSGVAVEVTGIPLRELEEGAVVPLLP